MKDLRWIRYNNTADAVVDDQGNIFATVRTIKRRSGALAFDVQGYSKLRGQFPELEGVYEARGEDEARRATVAIANQAKVPE